MRGRFTYCALLGRFFVFFFAAAAASSALARPTAKALNIHEEKSNHSGFLIRRERDEARGRKNWEK